MGVKFSKSENAYYIGDEQAGYEKVPAAQYEAQQEAENMGALEATGKGIGRTVEQFSEGALDLYYGLTGGGPKSEITGESMRDTLLEVGQDQAAAFKPIQEANPISTMVGQTLPYLATAPLAGSGVAANAALAGGLGMLRQTGDFGDRVKTGAIEGAFGGGGAAAGNLASRTVNNIRGIYASKTAAGLRNQGGKITPGQALDSPGLQTAENVMESTGAFNTMKQQNQELIQGQAARALGLEAGADLSETGLGHAADAIGARMDDALQGLDNISLNKDLIKRMDKVVGDNPFMDLPADYTKLTGKQYQKVRRQLTDAARTEARTASPTAQKGEYIAETIDQLDQEFLDIAGADKAQQLRVAREQYRNLVAMEKGQAITPDGIINPKTLRNNLNKQYKGARRGKNDRNLPATQELMEGARLQSSRALSATVGDSGTATRMGLGLGLPTLAAGGTALSGGDAGDSIAAAMMMGLLTKGYGQMGPLLMGAPNALATGGGRSLVQGLMQE